MRLAPFLSLAAALLCLSPSAGRAETGLTTVECSENDVRSEVAEGRLAITAFHFTDARADCPTRVYAPGARVRIEPGDPVYFWVRLEGDRAFLRRFGRNPSISFVVQRGRTAEAVPGGTIVRSRALAEAEGSGGRFDWRSTAYKQFYLAPARYVITVMVGGKRVCAAAGGRCQFVLNVGRK